eukprot:TRINITY_DN4856_c0_g1_i1.p1 TRINITY_DN4856_c0_g1~~TRINITY_DN4856_c0_g1_i1.p1  ORF type:complete len:283 (+),score=64.07 TRINITY_DN4856_c0_g1_i1:109-957(+)
MEGEGDYDDSNNGPSTSSTHRAVRGTGQLPPPAQLLLQYFIARRVVPAPIVRRKVYQIKAHFAGRPPPLNESTDNGAEQQQQQQQPLPEETEENVSELIARVNREIHFVWMEIKRTVAEASGVAYWVLINLRTDEHAQIATAYNMTELDYFKVLIKAIMTDKKGRGDVSTTDALNLSGQIPKKTAEGVIAALVEDNWLSETTKGRVTFGVRTMLELRPYLKDIYDEVLVECVICHDLVIYGDKCPNTKCQTKLHHHCGRRFFKTSKDKPRCPSCTTVWTTHT